MSKSIAISFLIGAYGLLLAQDAPAKKEEPAEAVIIPVKTLSGDSFNRLAKLLNVFQVRYSSDEKLRTILVYGTKDVIAQMRRVIEQLDQPGSDAAVGRNIELTMTFLRCSTKPSAESRPLPAELEAVARQLRAVTQYKDIQLWDMVPLHLQEGKEANQSLRLPSSFLHAALIQVNAAATANVRLWPESVVRKDSGRFVRFDRVNISFRIPYMTGPQQANNPLVGTQINYMELSLNTAGEFKDGQKTVLGKLSGIDDESAVFVVIAPKVLD